MDLMSLWPKEPEGRARPTSTPSREGENGSSKSHGTATELTYATTRERVASVRAEDPTLQQRRLQTEKRICVGGLTDGR